MLFRSNAFEANYGLPREGTVVLINIGASITTINILSQGIPSFTRNIINGGNAITEEIQKKAGIPFEMQLFANSDHGIRSPAYDAAKWSFILRNFGMWTEAPVGEGPAPAAGTPAPPAAAPDAPSRTKPKKKA